MITDVIVVNHISMYLLTYCTGRFCTGTLLYARSEESDWRKGKYLEVLKIFWITKLLCGRCTYSYRIVLESKHLSVKMHL